MSGRDDFPHDLDHDAVAEAVLDAVEQAVYRYGGSGHPGQASALTILCAAVAKAVYAYGSPSADADAVRLMSENVASMLAEMRGADEAEPDRRATHPGGEA